MTAQATHSGATAAGECVHPDQTRTLESGSNLVDAFTRVDRSTTWTLTGKQR